MSTETLLKSTIKLNPEASKMLRNRMEELDNQAVCKHIYGFSEGCGYEAWLEHKKPRDNDPCVELLFTYCPKCGKRLVD